MGRRSRKRSKQPAQRERPARKPSAERDAEARAQLEPLAPGELPLPLRLAIALSLLLAAANLALYVAHVKTVVKHPAIGSVVIYSAVMGMAAYGMWRQRYWAVLGFQALLAVTVIIAALALSVASNAEAAVVCLVVILIGGWLFWKLVRVLGRLQLPPRGP